MTVTKIRQLLNVSSNDYWQLTSSFGVPFNVQNMLDGERLERNGQALGIPKEDLVE